MEKQAGVLARDSQSVIFTKNPRLIPAPLLPSTRVLPPDGPRKGPVVGPLRADTAPVVRRGGRGATAGAWGPAQPPLCAHVSSQRFCQTFRDFFSLGQICSLLSAAENVCMALFSDTSTWVWVSQDASEWRCLFHVKYIFIAFVKPDFSSLDGDRELCLDWVTEWFVLVGVCALRGGWLCLWSPGRGRRERVPSVCPVLEHMASPGVLRRGGAVRPTPGLPVLPQAPDFPVPCDSKPHPKPGADTEFLCCHPINKNALSFLV